MLGERKMETWLQERADDAEGLASIPLGGNPEARGTWLRQLRALVELVEAQVAGPLSTTLNLREKEAISTALLPLKHAADWATGNYPLDSAKQSLATLGKALRDLAGRLAAEEPSGRVTVFFSWQSDVKAAACRTIIERALDAAVAKIAGDLSVTVEPVVDRDTANVAGAPDIASTILAKIDAASVFVADVTIIGTTAGEKARPTPNPNVLVELGYALKALGWPRVLLVQNSAFGSLEDLPFDLRQKRAITYCSPATDAERAPERRVLQRSLERALREIFEVSAKPAKGGSTRGRPR